MNQCKGCKHFQPWSIGDKGACDEIVNKNPVEYIAVCDGDVEVQYMEVSEEFYCAYWEKD